MLPAAFAPVTAEIIQDNFNPNLVRTIGAGIGVVSAFSFYLLHLKLGKRERFSKE